MLYVTWISIERGDSLYKCLVSYCTLAARGGTIPSRVAVYKRGLRQLLRRPVGQREWYWGHDRGR